MLAGLFLAQVCQLAEVTAQVAENFKVVAIAGGVAPGTKAFKLEIDAKGNCVYYKRTDDSSAQEQFVEVERFKIPDFAVERIYKTIKQNNFFSLKSNYINENIIEGSFAILTVTGDSGTHTVKTKNIAVKEFDRIMRAINTLTPGMDKVMYNEIYK